MCYKKQKHGRRSCKGFTHDLKLRLYKNKMSSPPGHGVLGAWKEGAGCPEGFPPQAGPRPPADACFTRPAAPSETGFLRPRDRQTRSRVGRWRQPHTTPGKQSPAAQPGRLAGMGRGSAQDTCPQTAAPAQGLGSAGGVGEGRGPMIWLKLEVAQRGLLLPRLYTAPEGGSQDSANSWAQPGLQGRPWTCGSHRRRGSEADTGATRGRVGGLLGAGSATLVRGVVAAEDEGHAPPETRGTR